MTMTTCTPRRAPEGVAGSLLSVHAVRLECLDETEQDGLGEGVANDAIRLFALTTTQVGGGAPQQCATPVLNLGDNYEDGVVVDFDEHLGTVWAEAAGGFPAKLSVVVTLGEEDLGGASWSEGTKAFVDRAGKAASEAVVKLTSTAVGTAIGSAGGPLGAAAGALVGYVAGEAVDLLVDAARELESDTLGVADASVVLDSPMAVLAGAGTSMQTRLDFTGGGGHYVLVLEWRLYQQAGAGPAAPSEPVLDHLEVILRTGDDDLRGGNDNLDIVVELTDGRQERFANVNRSERWADRTDHAVTLRLPWSVRKEQIRAFVLETTSRGGIGGDNWNCDGIAVTSALGTVLPEQAARPIHRFTGDDWHLRLTLDGR